MGSAELDFLPTTQPEVSGSCQVSLQLVLEPRPFARPHPTWCAVVRRAILWRAIVRHAIVQGVRLCAACDCVACGMCDCARCAVVRCTIVQHAVVRGVRLCTVCGCVACGCAARSPARCSFLCIVLLDAFRHLSGIISELPPNQSALEGFLFSEDTSQGV